MSWYKLYEEADEIELFLDAERGPVKDKLFVEELAAKFVIFIAKELLKVLYGECEVTDDGENDTAVNGDDGCEFCGVDKLNFDFLRLKCGISCGCVGNEPFVNDGIDVFGDDDSFNGFGNIGTFFPLGWEMD